METALTKVSPTIVAAFESSHRLSVRQRKRWIEIILSFDARNTYAVYDDAGNPVLNVQEQGKGIGNFFKRLFLASMRPFTSHVEDLRSQKQVLSLRKRFRFFFHRLEVKDADGNAIGAIQRRWTWFRRKYTVEGAGGQEVATLFGPLLRPWTFEIRLPENPDQEVGMIQKKWSGLAKELFTQADNFWIEMGTVSDPALRSLLFSATVLIDVVHFERKN
ncbi:MAG TPA: phospholipid scramblase-related protein [Kofleriaceae bacterium]|nr:phospholipid scramblase-related protein [Kofleriaceae bacterium]